MTKYSLPEIPQLQIYGHRVGGGYHRIIALKKVDRGGKAHHAAPTPSERCVGNTELFRPVEKGGHLKGESMKKRRGWKSNHIEILRLTYRWNWERRNIWDP